MTMQTNLHLTSSTVIECHQGIGAPVLTISDDGHAYGGVTVYFGDSSPVASLAAAAAQLDQLAAAVLAARMIITELEAEAAGPDDDDDEPTDEPVFPAEPGTERSGIPAAALNDGRSVPSLDPVDAIASTGRYRIDYRAADRTWEVYDHARGEAIATMLSLSAAIREVEDLTAQDAAAREPFRQAHPMAENEARAAWGDR